MRGRRKKAVGLVAPTACVTNLIIQSYQSKDAHPLKNEYPESMLSIIPVTSKVGKYLNSAQV